MLAFLKVFLDNLNDKKKRKGGFTNEAYWMRMTVCEDAQTYMRHTPWNKMKQHCTF